MITYFRQHLIKFGKTHISQVLNDIFAVSLPFFILLTLVNQIIPGSVSRYLSLHNLLIILVVICIGMTLTNNQEFSKIQQKLSKRNIFLLFLLLTLFLFQQLKDFQEQASNLIIFIFCGVGIGILLLSFFENNN
jgi:hypothetical protein